MNGTFIKGSALFVLELMLMSWPSSDVAQAQLRDLPPSVLTIAQAIRFGIDHYPSVRASLETSPPAMK